MCIGLLRWCLQESNQGHKDFQSFALPTELRHQLLLKAVANIISFLVTDKTIFIKNAFVNLATEFKRYEPGYRCRQYGCKNGCFSK